MRVPPSERHVKTNAISWEDLTMSNHYLHVPPSAMPLLPYLRRADDIETFCPLASFFCRLYVADHLQKLPPEHRSEPGFMELLHTQVEKAELLSEKSTDPLTREDFEAFCRGMYDAADKEDRSGVITKHTMQSFYCTGLFYDVLESIQPLSPEDTEKWKYVKYKSAYIKRCLESGETPVGGLTLSDQRQANAHYPSSTNTVPCPITSPQTHAENIVATLQSSPRGSGTSFEDVVTAIPNGNLSAFVSTQDTAKSTTKDPNTPLALRKTRLALNALEFNDVESARGLLKDALDYLG